MQGKRILLGITGGIAAYKIAYLIRILKKRGAEVKCIMTPASSDFISPLVVSTLSENPVSIEFWDRSSGLWTNHVDLALWADIFLIAPLTANTLAAMANGTCDNLLLAVYFSMKGKTMIAPAMDLDMYKHPTTNRNLRQLSDDGVIIIPAEEGELASGLEGVGRMAEPQKIAQHLDGYFNGSLEFEGWFGKKVLITAGPTYESIDPVRFIGNYSSGKMGFALAEEAAARGAEVFLISGPSALKIAHPRIKQVNVVTALQMFDEVQKYWSGCDVGIFSAAVADYRSISTSSQKIKKKDEGLVLELIKNPDILAWAGGQKENNQILVGFALETENLQDNARLKLASKNLNIIVMNSLQDDGAGFAYDSNKVSLLDDRNNLISFELKSKKAVAKDILEAIIAYRC